MQLDYGQNMAPAYAGMIADTSVNRIDSYVAENAIGIGTGVAAGTKVDKQVKVPAGTGFKFRGVALLQAKEQDASGNAVYAATATVPVLNMGRIWVNVKGAVAIDGAVYLIHTGADAGKFIGTASANQDLVAGATFKTATTGDGIAVVEFK